MDVYLFAIIILVGLAIFDLMVGVSNDAVNFLNSSVGSKVASRRVILFIASLGMLAGAMLAGMMMDLFRLRQAFPLGAVVMLGGVVFFYICARIEEGKTVAMGVRRR